MFMYQGKENDSSLSSAELDIAILLERIISITPYYTTEVCHFEMQVSYYLNVLKIYRIKVRKKPSLTLVTMVIVKYKCFVKVKDTLIRNNW